MLKIYTGYAWREMKPPKGLEIKYVGESGEEVIG